MPEPESRPIPIWGATKCSGRLTRRATSVTPAEVAGRTYYPYERCTRWTGGLQQPAERCLELASESSAPTVAEALRALALDYLMRSPGCAGVNQSNLDQAAAGQVGPINLRIIRS